jgi:hypothetical protein
VTTAIAKRPPCQKLFPLALALSVCTTAITKRPLVRSSYPSPLPVCNTAIAKRPPAQMFFPSALPVRTTAIAKRPPACSKVFPISLACMYHSYYKGATWSKTIVHIRFLSHQDWTVTSCTENAHTRPCRVWGIPIFQQYPRTVSPSLLILWNY